MKNYNEMTNDELYEIRDNINTILEKRADKKKEEAIEKFRVAFNEVKQLFYEIYVGDPCGTEPSYYIDEFAEFHFEE